MRMMPAFLIFGADAATNVDQAFAIMNSLSNVDSYTSDLSEFPLQSQHINFTAQSSLLDGYEVVDPAFIGGNHGPGRAGTRLPGRSLNGFYLLVEFVPLMKSIWFCIEIWPLHAIRTANQVQYSTYVNNVLYTYFIEEICSVPKSSLAITVNYPADPLTAGFTAVAANNHDGFGGPNVTDGGGGLQIGGYYTPA